MAPISMPLGWRVFFAGVAYNLALPTVAARSVEPRWIRIWLFLLPLSWLMIAPDWFLAAGLETLVFPQAVVTVGPVSAFMGLLWIIPLFLVVYAGDRVAEQRGVGLAVGVSAALALVLFAIAEATLTHLDLWRAVGVQTLGGMALYVLAPEAILGGATFWAYQWSVGRGVLWRLAAAVAVMLTYTASLGLFWALLEA